MPTSEAHEEARLQLAETWLDELAAPDGEIIVAPADAIPVATFTRRATVHCDHCGGGLTRSHIAPYERALTFFTNRRPYRCMGCRRRRWREPLRSTVQQ
jgi:hypothetical protein